MFFKRMASTVFFLLFTVNLFAAEWELATTDDDLGIKVYTRAVAGSPLKEFKGVIKVKSTLNGLVSLVSDTENRPNWMFNMLTSKVLKKINEKESYIYSVNKTGPFIDDRDSIVHSVLEQDPETKIVTIRLEGKPEYIPVSDDAVRVASINGLWEFSPNSDGTVDVVHQIHADPSGSIPQSLINSFIVKSPLETLAGLQEQVQKYQDKKLDFIVE